MAYISPEQIHPNAWKSWDRHTVPLLLTDVIQALVDLPEDKVTRGWAIRPVRRYPTLEGEVAGRRFRLIGERDDADEEWSVIFEVQPL